MIGSPDFMALLPTSEVRVQHGKFAPITCQPTLNTPESLYFTRLQVQPEASQHQLAHFQFPIT